LIRVYLTQYNTGAITAWGHFSLALPAFILMIRELQASIMCGELGFQRIAGFWDDSYAAPVAINNIQGFVHQA